MLTYIPAYSIFDGPITNLLSILSILIEIFSCAHAKGGNSLNDFKFGTFIGRFLNNGAASMTVKGLKPVTICLTRRSLSPYPNQTAGTGLRHPSFGGRCRKAMLGVCTLTWQIWTDHNYDWRKSGFIVLFSSHHDGEREQLPSGCCNCSHLWTVPSPAV